MKKGGDINSVDFEGKTPLMHAVIHGNNALISYLVAYPGYVLTTIVVVVRISYFFSFFQGLI